MIIRQAAEKDWIAAPEIIFDYFFKANIFIPKECQNQKVIHTVDAKHPWNELILFNNT